MGWANGGWMGKSFLRVNMFVALDDWIIGSTLVATTNDLPFRTTVFAVFAKIAPVGIAARWGTSGFHGAILVSSTCNVTFV